MSNTHLQKIIFKSEKAIARWVTSGNPRDFYWARRWLNARLGGDSCGHIEMMLTITRRALHDRFTGDQSEPTIKRVLPASLQSDAGDVVEGLLGGQRNTGGLAVSPQGHAAFHRHLSARLAAVRKRAAIARMRAEQLKMRYRNGAANYLDVYLAELARMEAERTELSAQADLLTQRVQLARALGGGR